MRVVNRQRISDVGDRWADVLVIAENAGDSDILDCLGKPGQKIRGQVRLADGYGEHYLLLRSASAPPVAEVVDQVAARLTGHVDLSPYHVKASEVKEALAEYRNLGLEHVNSPAYDEERFEKGWKTGIKLGLLIAEKRAREAACTL